MREILSQAIKDRFERWIENHPDVWYKNEHGVPHFWWVQNALGDIFGWDKEWVEFVSFINKKHEERS